MARTRTGPTHPTRLEIVRVTRELLETQGIGAFKLSDVLERAHVSKGSFYHHFADFDELLDVVQLEVLDELVADDLASLHDLVETSQSTHEFEDRLFQAARVTLSPQRAAVRRQRLQIVAAAAGETLHLQRGLSTRTGQLVQTLAGTIARAQERAFVASDIDTVATARLLLGLIYGQVFIELGLPDETPRQTAEAYVRLLRGILETSSV